MNDPHVTFTLSIDSGNAGLVDDPNLRVADILARVATDVADGYTSGLLHDVMGNSVGHWSLDAAASEEN